MSKPISFGQLDFELTASMNSENGIVQPDTPFKIAVLGDFSGRASKGVISPVDMRPIMVDRDNLDELIGKLGVEVHLSLEDESKALAISFEELDDFHPDQIYSRLDIFKSLRDIRSALNNPDSYASAAAEVRTWFPSQQKQTVPHDTKETPTISPQSSGSLLDQIVTEATGETLEPIHKDTQESELASFLHQIVDPHLVPAEDPQKDELRAAVDTIISQVMEAILHHPEFQAIEAGWRSVNFLVRRLETGTDLKIYLFDVSKDELIADIGSTEDLSATAFYQHFVKQTVETYGGTPWAVIVGNYHFDHTFGDIELLGRIAKIVQKAGAPFIAGANDKVLGCESITATPDPSAWKTLPSEEVEAWKMLRNISESSYLGLALPNFILRLPYGEDTDPIDMFEFEEFPSPSGHYGYLWGNPAIACAFLLGKSFTLNGWDMRAHMIQDIEKLPLHIYKENGETKIKACAEMVMTERAAATIMEKGFMPLLSFVNQDKVRLGRFQSITDPPTQLAGRWK